MSEKLFFKNISKPFIKEKLRANKRLVVFLIFIGIATFIWFLWTLEKEYTSLISNPIEFVGFPEDRILVNDLPDRIQLEVRGEGFNLLRHNWDITKSPLKIDFKALHNAPLSDEDGQTIVLHLNQITIKLSAQLSNINVNSVIPETISVKFDRMIRKTVPVTVDLDLELEKQYMLRGGLIITPDSIEISGPSTILDTLSSVYTNKLRLRKVDGNIHRNLGLVDIHDKLSFSQKKIQVDIPVEQFTEKSIEAPILGINIPDSMHLKLFPANAKLTFRVVISEFEAIQPENFKLNVDYAKITEGTPSRLSILILQSPEYISNIKINPETVGYILENK